MEVGEDGGEPERDAGKAGPPRAPVVGEDQQRERHKENAPEVVGRVQGMAVHKDREHDRGQGGRRI